MRKIFLALSLMTLFIACTNNKSKEERNQLKVARDKEITELITSHNAIILDKDLNNYSYILYEKLTLQKKLLAFKGEIADVSINDSVLIIQATAEIDEHMYAAEMTGNIKLFQKVKQFLKYSDRRKQKGTFIMHVSKIFSKIPPLELDGDDESGPFITFGEVDTRIIILKGELIDLIIK